MDWLFHNSLAEMYGPNFLMLYGVVIALTLAICYFAASCFPLAGHAPPAIREEPDPYEIAYLRGGENEVVRLAIFRLLQSGQLQTEGEAAKKLRRGANVGSVGEPSSSADFPGELSPIEEETLLYLDRAQDAKEVFASDLPRRIGQLCDGYEERLRRAGMLNGSETGAFVLLIGGAVILGLGGYKLTAALNNGHHNVGFLIFMGLIGLALLKSVCHAPRLSPLGRQHLERMQAAFGGLRTRIADGGDGAQAQSEAALTLALFGVSVLAVAPYMDYHLMFQRAAYSAAGGCGSASATTSSATSSGGGCGGGGCGGGGCGGGGCGGGGCGGCGGG